MTQTKRDTENMEIKNSITLAEYIFRRLRSSGTYSLFGVPGDFNLPLLESLYHKTADGKEVELLNWIGCCNELNAAYAADGYSRYTNKIGCLVTTFGVGEISALNGIVGAAVENVKVLNIVGIPPTHILNSSQYNIHHSIPNLKNSNSGVPNYKTYCDMVLNNITNNVEFLELSDIKNQNSNQVCNKIDQLIKNIFISSKPGYLFVPSNMTNMMVSSANLTLLPQINLDWALKSTRSNLSETIENDIIEEISQLLYKSKKPCILCDVFIDRFDCRIQVNQLISKLNIWNFSTMLGKSIIDEDNDRFMGTYNGVTSDSYVKDNFESCDLILHLGIETNEMNTGCYSFSYLPDAVIIEVGKDYIKISKHDGKISKIINDIMLRDVIQKLLHFIDDSKCTYSFDNNVESFPTYKNKLISKKSLENNVESKAQQTVTQDDLQVEIQTLFDKGDVVVVETGSFQFAIPDMIFPKETKLINQGFYLSIGMALPASLGVGIGMRDYPNCHINDNSEDATPKKLILFEGDGAAQMTIQELSSLLRYRIPIDIFIWNNNGYTVERIFEGEKRSYNDIMPWKWVNLLKVFGDHEKTFSKSTTISTVQELRCKIDELKNANPQKIIELIEVKLGEMDIPKNLKHIVEQMKLRQQNKSLIE
ncbi:hypothetical protein TPHA_0J02680 [Tetrapisispora phaffii CBS 4417]|uniref:Pyruvate decarboxylase n=1 Tax=Tetrapisispora phaffii (strain ATCC 24235 / CBS 4417 / NBRC 1672 / NRRL Y-8282 / UCD 70-5) TaxID=1071381 RepID=G8BYZ6_TETPH|nr:hypothetical protein TPHA_0J02680 [Tetrapisispora phaffii CBS 4417]CCE65088.1 hypothetical protein TPHA_0J02680 [Tetrapisispora phaffii CBS 4417]